MTAIYAAWAVSAGVLLALAALLGRLMVPARFPLGLLIDQRGRYSLSSFQLVMWSLIVLSLLSGVFWGRLIDGVVNPLSFSVPANVLGLLGISAGSAASATAVKASKDATRSESIAASASQDMPRFSQVFLQEEGGSADKVVDVSKYQNFVITIVLAIAYVALACQAIDHAGTGARLTSLPDFSSTFLVLLGISHGAYVAGKLPNPTGTPQGLTMAKVTAASREGALTPAVANPRNPPRQPSGQSQSQSRAHH
jgi:hypothetical protein